MRRRNRKLTRATVVALLWMGCTVYLGCDGEEERCSSDDECRSGRVCGEGGRCTPATDTRTTESPDAAPDSAEVSTDKDVRETFDSSPSCSPDVDGDGVGLDDNCPETSNAGQEDADGDGVGDACDNCPKVANVRQEDSDEDGTGDVCEDLPPPYRDSDGDGVNDLPDNCPQAENADQNDGDGDGAGDVCDNCPDVVNPNQYDSDENDVGDACQKEPVAPTCVREEITLETKTCTIQLSDVPPGAHPHSNWLKLDGAWIAASNFQYDGENQTVELLGSACMTAKNAVDTSGNVDVVFVASCRPTCPGESEEICDYEDNDCDGTVDEGCESCELEVCDEEDNDCDADIDEGCCRPSGVSCSADGECCLGLCDGGTCAECLPEEASGCSTDENCCRSATCEARTSAVDACIGRCVGR